jgi:RNA polymerase sigma-70 factor (ECF subfamily)
VNPDGRSDAVRADFRELFDRHYSVVLAYLLRRVGNREDAEDLAASVFRVAWQKLEVVPPEPDTRRWLLVVAANTVRNHRRSQWRRERLFGRVASADAPPTAFLLAVDLDDGDPPIRRAFDSLSETHREVLRLIVWEGLSNSETAEMLGINVNAANVRIHRARRELRVALERIEQGAAPQRHRRRRRTPGSLSARSTTAQQGVAHDFRRTS